MGIRRKRTTGAHGHLNRVFGAFKPNRARAPRDRRAPKVPNRAAAVNTGNRLTADLRRATRRAHPTPPPPDSRCAHLLWALAQRPVMKIARVEHAVRAGDVRTAVDALVTMPSRPGMTGVVEIKTVSTKPTVVMLRRSGELRRFTDQALLGAVLYHLDSGVPWDKLFCVVIAVGADGQVLRHVCDPVPLDAARRRLQL
jgi:hypothetical protein